MKARITERLRELSEEELSLIERVKEFQDKIKVETHNLPKLEVIEQIDKFTKELLVKKSAIAELKALLE